MKLNSIVSGDENGGVPVLLAHGLFGSARNLGGLARRMSGERKVIAVDMRNHGDSPHDPDHSYPALAADLAEVIAANGGVADVVGHSMGGKAAMTLALTRPELVRKLVAMDIAPFAYGHDQQELLDAMRDLDLDGIDRRSEADRRMAAVISDPGVRAFLLQNLDLKADPPQWKPNLDVLAAEMDKLVGWPDGLQKGAFDGPALFLAGGASHYAAEGAAADAIRAYFPQAELQYIAGCGHWLHAEEPKLVADMVADFLG